MTIEKRALCAGLVSRCKGHYHYFFDMDDATEAEARYSATYISKLFRCDIIIRNSGKGYHLLCPNPMMYSTVLDMQRWTPTNQAEDFFTLDELKGIFPTKAHWDKPTGSVLRASKKGRRPAPQTVAVITNSKHSNRDGFRVWCEVYAFFTGKVPEGRKVRASHPIFVFYETASKVS